jgi:hypothetical protein
MISPASSGDGILKDLMTSPWRSDVEEGKSVPHGSCDLVSPPWKGLHAVYAVFGGSLHQVR